jgi:hypothetical protein
MELDDSGPPSRLRQSEARAHLERLQAQHSQGLPSPRPSPADGRGR